MRSASNRCHSIVPIPSPYADHPDYPPSPTYLPLPSPSPLPAMPADEPSSHRLPSPSLSESASAPSPSHVIRTLTRVTVRLPPPAFTGSIAQLLETSVRVRVTERNNDRRRNKSNKRNLNIPENQQQTNKEARQVEVQPAVDITSQPALPAESAHPPAAAAAASPAPVSESPPNAPSIHTPIQPMDDPSRRFQCTVLHCSRWFATKRGRRVHIDWYHGGMDTLSHPIDPTSSSPSTANVAGVGTFHCRNCKRNFLSSKLLETHLARSAIEPCQIVRRRGPREAGARRTSTRDTDHRWRCSLCRVTFTSRRACQEHITSYTNKFECSKCHSYFGREYDLIHHQQQNRNRKKCRPVQKNRRHPHTRMVEKQPWEAGNARPECLEFIPSWFGSGAHGASTTAASDNRTTTDEEEEIHDNYSSTALCSNLLRLHPLNARHATTRSGASSSSLVSAGVASPLVRYPCHLCRSTHHDSAADSVMSSGRNNNDRPIRSYATLASLTAHIYSKHLGKWRCQHCQLACSSGDHQRRHQATCTRVSESRSTTPVPVAHAEEAAPSSPPPSSPSSSPPVSGSSRPSRERKRRRASANAHGIDPTNAESAAPSTTTSTTSEERANRTSEAQRKRYKRTSTMTSESESDGTEAAPIIIE